MTILPLPAEDSLSPRARVLGFGLLILIPALFALALLVIAPPAVLETTDGQAQIHFSAERNRVFLTGQCVVTRWQVEGIQEVYINDLPTLE